jgi:hypothetical protein
VIDPSPTVAERSPLPTLGNVASALPDFILSAFCLTAWVAPGRLAPDAVNWILLTMLLEFVVMHSAAFMGLQLIATGDRRARALSVLGLGLFYSIFAGGFAAAFHSWWPLVSFWLLTLNRLTGVLFKQSPGGEERAFLQAGWAASGISYLLGAGLTTFLPLPRLGITADVVSELHLTGSGLWVSEPWRVVAFGVLYFAAMGAFEWTGFRSLRVRMVTSEAS